MTSILLLSGPNLNLLGTREPEIYGTATLDDHVTRATETASRFGMSLRHLQSNHEGVLIDAIHEARGVDDAIVMLETIVRHMEDGLDVREAAFRGAREIGFTIMSMTLSLVAVFIPLMFMGGIIGRLLHEFAVTITASILVSGVVSLTLTPMLCSRFLKPHAAHADRKSVV